MSGETQSHSRKRRERKKKKECDQDKLDIKNVLNEDDDSCKEDTDDHDAEWTKSGHANDYHHGGGGGILSTVVYFLLLGGLVVLTSMIFLELKGSKETGPSIAESRYASILGDFVDEWPHEEDDHAESHAYIVSEEHDEDGHEEHAENGYEEHAEDGNEERTEDENGEHVEDVKEEHVEDGNEEHTEDGNEEPAEDRNVEQVDEGVPKHTEGENVEDLLELSHYGQEEAASAEKLEEDEQRTSDHLAEEIILERLSDAPSETPSPENAFGDAGSQDETEGGATLNRHEALNEWETEQEMVMEPEEVVVLENTEHIDIFTEHEPSPITMETRIEEDVQHLVEDGDQQHNAPEETDDITSKSDDEYSEELDATDAQLENSETAEKTARTKAIYEDILNRHPGNPRAVYGKARTLDKLSEQMKSNAILEQSIKAYEELLSLPQVPDRLFRLAGERCIDRMRFRGFIEKATKIQSKLIRRFPDDASFQNQLAVSHLLLGQNLLAKKILKQVLTTFPNDGFAKVHLGFILKTDENNYKEAIRYLREGIESEEPGTQDGRFYFHLGDALTREGLRDQAFAVYEDGVRKGLFLSTYQRSLYNVALLTGRPWWNVEETTYGEHLRKLEDNWQTIRDEGLGVLNGMNDGFLPETENLRDTGTWKQFEIYSRGNKIAVNCGKVPQTCKLIESIPDAAGCKRGQVKFSIMLPGTHVWPHAGPTNCRIRAHLGLIIPDGVRIRVANETRSWIEGKFIVFDDSFEHEVWHTGSGIRLVLIVDLWHPELNAIQKKTLTPI